MSIALQIKNLSFHFNDHAKNYFFDQLNLSFAANQLHFIRGKNGAGKSTLFRVMQGSTFNDEHCQGTITVNGNALDIAQSLDRHILNDHVRMVVQKFDGMIADQFTFTQNLELATMPHYPKLESFTQEYNVPQLVKRFGIDFSVPAEMLSGGQRQILAILMALQKKASILLLDEPTAALDHKNAEMVMAFLQELLSLDKQLTVLIICHDKELVEQYAHQQYYEINVGDTITRTIDIVTLT